ncbi:MAG: hypothetical protein LM590_15705 [Thermofilum sp.]|nr:hypothetical protein [Thermofilum sp.]
MARALRRHALQYGYADTSSRYAVYGLHANWYFIALTEKGPLAREAYGRRLRENLDFARRLAERYRSLARA